MGGGLAGSQGQHMMFGTHGIGGLGMPLTPQQGSDASGNLKKRALTPTWYVVWEGRGGGGGCM